MVVRTCNGRDKGPGGTRVFLTHTPVDKLLQPFDDDDKRSIIEHGYIKESKQQWGLKHPPQKTARVMQVHVIFSLLRFALARSRGCDQIHDDLMADKGLAFPVLRQV